MRSKTIETLIGAVVLLIAVMFVYFAYQGAGINPDHSYPIKAKFDSVDGLTTGSDVRIGGIKIGVVAKQELGSNYEAIIVMNIYNNVKVPKDSTAQVVGDGLLGSKFVSLSPGGSEDFLTENGEIKITQSSVNFETLLGKFIFGSAEEKKKEEDKGK